MPKIKKSLKLILPFLALLLLPAVAFAQNCTGNCVQSGLTGIRSIFPSGGLANSQNPIQLIGFVISLLLTVAGAIAVVFVIIGGFMYITAAGNEEQAEKGRKALTNAIIGIIIVILSYVIINVTVNFVSGGFSLFGFSF